MKIIHTTFQQHSHADPKTIPIVTVMNLWVSRNGKRLKNHYWITDNIHGMREISRYNLFRHYRRVNP